MEWRAKWKQFHFTSKSLSVHPNELILNLKEPPEARRLRKNLPIDIAARGSLVVKALSYKSKGLGFETQWGEILNLPDPSGRTRPWGLLSL
jgi:hypothetical protein